MRKVTLYISMSLDGFAADTDGGVDWLYGNEPDCGEGSYEDFISGVDTVIMGRKTYEQVTGELSPGEWPYAGLSCYVLTRKKRENLPGITFTDTEPADLVAALRAEPGRGIWICGGPETAGRFLRAGLVNEYRIAVIPALLGGGVRLFGDLAPRRLRLVRTLVYGGIAELIYENNDNISDKYEV